MLPFVPFPGSDTVVVVGTGTFPFVVAFAVLLFVSLISAYRYEKRNCSFFHLSVKLVTFVY